MSNADDIMNSPINDEPAPKCPPGLSDAALESHKEPLSYTKAMQVAGLLQCERAVCYWNVSRKCIIGRKCVGHPPKPPVP